MSVKTIAAAALLCAVSAGVAVAQNYSAAPTYGTVTLNTGFTPDPQVVQVQSGGSVDASTLNNQQHAGSCAGMIATNPDVRLQYTSGTTFPLILSVSSQSDTTLVVNGPDGSWYCDDDSGVNGLNPALRWDHPASGQYDIWIGTFGSATLQPAQLYISEETSQ